MKNTVIIKGNKYGITIVLDDKIPFQQLLLDLSDKLEKAEEFFDSDKQLAISFEGRELSNDELDELLFAITNKSCLNIQYVMDCNNDTEATYYDIIQDATSNSSDLNQYTESENLTYHDEIEPIDTFNDDYISNSLENDNNGLFYRGTLRSGQKLEATKSIIIIGDVNPGAHIYAKDNIIVIGTLKGSAYAGCDGNQNAFIVALSMNPLHLQIADIKYAIHPKHRLLHSKSKDATIAMCNNDKIIIQKISKSSMYDLNI